ncbi:DUF892 family protein [Salinicola salarius]|uniref:DUF892 family protein n=1 Tax=Salinicola salarius TaxID=430457 RepID=UPI00350E3483
MCALTLSQRRRIFFAAYGTLCAMAEQLGYTEAKDILAETLKEEKATDDKLSKLAKQNVNQKAG